MRKTLSIAAFSLGIAASMSAKPADAQYYRPVYQNGNYGTVPQGTGTSYAPNYQFNNPANMMRLNQQNANMYNYGSPYGYGAVSPYGYGGYYGAPTLLNGSAYGFNMGGQQYNMWRGPSGYYYPWMYNNSTVTQMPMAMSVSNSGSQAAKPPLNTMISDMTTYLDAQHKEGKLTDGDFQSMKQRALDLQSKLQSVQKEQEGVIDPQTDTQLRGDINALGSDISHRMKP